MPDYRKFLGQAPQELVLPVLGGDRVDAPDRALRLQPGFEPGWWRVAVQGRVATPLARADAPDLSTLPRVRGFLLGDRLVSDGGRVARVHLLPPDEPARFAPASARRWHGGQLLFEQLEFESGVEEEVRRALEDGRTLAEVKGAPAALRAAFALALVEPVSRRLQIPAHPAELRTHLGELAEGGVPAAERVLRQLQAARIAYQARQEEQVPVYRSERPVPPSSDERAAAALESAGARLRRLRSLQGNLLEVVYDLEGMTFASLVDASTLQVVDAGICLAGADRLVTLESLPSVIREAIDTGALVVTHHVER